MSFLHRMVGHLLWLATVVPVTSAHAEVTSNILAGNNGTRSVSFADNVSTTAIGHVKPGPAGSENTGSGTETDPWHSINYALTRMTLAQKRTLYVHPGSYPNTQVNFNQSAIPSGTASAPMAIVGLPVLDAQGNPVLDAKGQKILPELIAAPSTPLDVNSPMFRMVKQYWVFDGLRFNLNQTPRQAIRFTSTSNALGSPVAKNVVLRNSIVHSGKGTAAVATVARTPDTDNPAPITLAQYVDNIYIQNNIIHDNYRPRACDASSLANVKANCRAGLGFGSGEDSDEDLESPEASEYKCENSLCAAPNLHPPQNATTPLYTCGSHSDCRSGYYCSNESICRRRDDLHAVGVFYGSSNVWVENNTMFDNSGDAMQCNGPKEVELGLIPEGRPVNVSFTSNHAYATPSSYGWTTASPGHPSVPYGTTETGVDIKDCNDVTVSGGSYHGFRSVGAEERGSAMVAHFTAKGIKIENVNVYDSCGGLSTGNSNKTGSTDTVENLIVMRSAFHDMQTPSVCGRDPHGIQATVLMGADIVHNVFSNIRGKSLSFGEVVTNSVKCTNIDVWNNILSESSPGAMWLGTNTGGMNDVEIDYNLYYNSSDTAGVEGSHFHCNTRSSTKNLSQWKSCSGGCTSSNTGSIPNPECSPEPKEGNPNFVDAAFNTSSSFAQNTAHVDGSNSGPNQRCGGGPDKGALESDCSTTTPPPPLPPIPVWSDMGLTNYTVSGPITRLDSLGRPVVARGTPTVSGFTTNIEVKRWTGTAWQSVGTTLQATSWGPISLQLAIDSYDNPIVAWSGNSSTYSATDIFVRRWTGLNWQALGTDISAHSGNDTNAFATAIAVDRSDTLTISFTELSASASPVPYVWQWDSSSSSWVSLNTPGGVGALLIDALYATPVIAWSDNSSVYVESWDGSAWNLMGTRRSISGQATAPSLVLDSTNGLVVAFSDVNPVSNSADIYVEQWNGSSWVSLGSGLSGSSASGSHASAPSLALTAAAHPVVAWTEVVSSGYKTFVSEWNTAVWTPLKFGGFVGSAQTPSASGGVHLEINAQGSLWLSWWEQSLYNPQSFVFEGVR